MTLQEVTKGLAYLGIAFNRQYTPEECKVYYNHLKSYSYLSFKNGIRNYIESHDFAPTIRQLMEMCDKPHLIEEKVNVDELIALRDRLEKEIREIERNWTK